MKHNNLISIVGPTAIGKTSTAIALAKDFSSEIISADSRQFFREMRIGTAVPNKEELAQVKHHFIQQRSIKEAYSVGDFEKEAIQQLENLFKKHKYIFMVGGSGLYVKAVTEGLDYFPKVPAQIRTDLNEQLKTEGLSNLVKELEEKDPAFAAKADLNNPQRVIRALEICRATNKTFSYFRNQPKPKRNFNTIKIGLFAPREIIYKRIEKRVDIMMTEGLLEEAKNLYPYKDLNALNTVGYKELFLYLDNKISLEDAVIEIKKNTRRFAKRQLTWFRKEQEIKWFSHTAPTKEIKEYIIQKSSPRQ